MSVHLEWMVRARQVPGDSLVDHGGFAHLVWNIDKAWEIGARYGFVEALEADPLDPDEVGQRHRVQLQTTFRPSHFSRIRLQGAWDAPEWRDEPIWAGVLALELLIGAHGAHTF